MLEDDQTLRRGLFVSVIDGSMEIRAPTVTPHRVHFKLQTSNFKIQTSLFCCYITSLLQTPRVDRLKTLEPKTFNNHNQYNQYNQSEQSEWFWMKNEVYYKQRQRAVSSHVAAVSSVQITLFDWLVEFCRSATRRGLKQHPAPLWCTPPPPPAEDTTFHLKPLVVHCCSATSFIVHHLHPPASTVCYSPP